MMQMYRVRFARKLPNDMVDVGDCVVCAASHDAAKIMVAEILKLLIATTEFEVARVKPSIHLIGRREVNKKMPTIAAELVDAELACTGTFPGVTENSPEEHWHEVEASAHIFAENEETAIAKLARGLIRYLSGERQKSSTKELQVKSDRSDWRPSQYGVRSAENALYTHLRFFKGGSARGK
jgi:hypothetical protein